LDYLTDNYIETFYADLDSGRNIDNLVEYANGMADDYGWAWNNPDSVLREVFPLSPWYGTLQTNFNVDIRNTWDPLVIDLDGDGVNADIVTDRVVYFDLDGDGLAEATNWIGASDAFLVRDVNGNGRIDDGTEVFGNQSLNGFEALKALDSNGDGKITAADAAYSMLELWQDLNQNGVSEAGELRTLSDAGITSIDVANYKIPASTGYGLTHISTVTTDNETQLEIANVAFRPDVRNTHYMQDYDLDLRALFLPTMRGYGKVADLHVALSLDNAGTSDTLMSQALHLVSYTMTDLFANWDAVKADFREFLLNWAGVDGISPTSRGTYVDAQELTFLENYMGSDFISGNFSAQGVQTSPGSQQAISIHGMFEDISDRLLGNFFGQTSVAGLFDLSGSYSLENDQITINSLNLAPDKLDELSLYAEGLVDTASRQEFWLGVSDFINGYEITTAKHLSTTDETLLDAAVSSSDAALVWSYENHDPTNGITSIEYRHESPAGEVILGTSGDDSSLNGTSFEDTILGLGGSDTIYGGNLADRIFGHNEDGSGDDGSSDILYGDDGNDYLDGGAGDDILYGGIGNDYLVGGSGNDILNELGSRQQFEQNYMVGGADDDTYITGGGVNECYIEDSSGLDTVNIALAPDMSFVSLARIGDLTLRLESSTVNYSNYAMIYLVDQLGNNSADQGIEYIKFYNGTVVDFKSYLAGYTAQITTYGSDSNDTINGITVGSPNDLIYAKNGDDVVYGDDGNDIVFGGEGNDEIHGGIGADNLRGENGNDIIYGDEGNDYINTGSGNDIAYGGEGNDEIWASGTAVIYGDAGNDYIFLNNTSSSSVAYGGEGDDTISGGIWNDILVGGAGNDAINGGAGNDTASYIDAGNGVIVNLSLGYADALNMGHDIFTSIENLSGSFFDDILTGDNSANILAGNDGNDRLDGKGNNDILYGENGDDLLFGGDGRDILYGGAGNDQLDGGESTPILESSIN